MDESVTCIDLFAGCGGFSLGLHRAGLKILAAIDFDPKAVEVYQANFPDHPHVLCEDLTKFAPADLAKLIGTNQVDVIAGGPPCQGFSQVRQRDGANNGIPTGSPSQSETVYYVVMDDEGIWMMTQTPGEDDEILFQTTDQFTAERALCIELARR